MLYILVGLLGSIFGTAITLIIHLSHNKPVGYLYLDDNDMYLSIDEVNLERLKNSPDVVLRIRKK